jgi:hypothetical protein
MRSGQGRRRKRCDGGGFLAEEEGVSEERCCNGLLLFCKGVVVVDMPVQFWSMYY